jgi:hypothetical protein
MQEQMPSLFPSAPTIGQSTGAEAGLLLRLYDLYVRRAHVVASMIG